MNLDKLCPPGYQGEKERDFYVLWAFGILIVVCSIVFLINFGSARAEITHVVNNKKVLSGIIEPFGSIMVGNFVWYWCYFALCVYKGVHNYMYFIKSNSIYVMARVSDKWEMHKRCLTLPVMGAIGGLILIAILTIVFYGIYSLSIPSRCLPDESNYQFWRMFTW